MADELEFVCEKCVHYEVCDSSSRMIWARLSKEKVCSDFMEVVRCKDCIHRHSSEFCECRPEDGYCNDGERKDNE